MSNFYGEAIKRDEELVIGLCHAARTMRKDLREWAQAELKAVLVAAELQEIQEEGVVKEQITGVIERLRAINQRDLPKADESYNDATTEVMNGGYADVYEAYDKLQMEYAGLIRIMRQLLDERSFIGEMGDT